MKKIFILILFLFVFATLNAQEDQVNQTLEDLIEEISSSTEEELDYSTLYDDLNFFMNEPINLNETTREELEKLQFINEIQIQGIIDYITKYGKMCTIYELQLVEGFDKEDIKRILPFVTVEVAKEQLPFNIARALKYGAHDVFLKTQFYVQDQSGYDQIPDSVLAEDPDKNRYLGNKYKYYVRYKFHYKNQIQWGMTMEKDPGEEFFAGTQKQGFDFYSAHVQIDNVWKIKRLVLGDFSGQFGQGLAFWPGMSTGKSSYTLNIKKKPQNIKKYSSVDENIFLRGVGAIMKFGKFEVTGFCSYKNIDANITSLDTIDDEEFREISSLLITGYHTTPNEVADKHAISELIYGGNLTFREEKFKLGLTTVAYNLGAELNKNPQPYNQFEFQGSSNINASIDYHFILKEINIFGEAAISKNGAMAFLNGASIPLCPQFSLAALHRYYQRDYQAYYAGAFGEGAKVANEQGLYLGAEIYPYKRWKISTYFDKYSFDWLTSTANAPSNGYDYLVQVDYNPTSKVSMYLKYKHEIKPENTSDGDANIKYLENVEKWAVRYNISYALTSWLTIKNRIEISSYEKGDNLEQGYLVYQDIKFTPKALPLTVYFRYGIFNAPYNARIYSYENDILYAFSIPGYYYEGFRTYITLNYDFTDKIAIWLRYGQFTYTDSESISEGSLTEIDGNTKSEVKAQIRINF